LLEVTTEEWDKLFAINTRGVFLCYTEAAKLMIEQGTGGKIIGACSVSGYRSSPMLSPYSVTKWGVRGLTQAAAMEWAKYKIWDSIDEELGKYERKQKGEVIKENSILELKKEITSANENRLLHD
jgi:meso-butanediol dehydrogenase/(S,S)-butanediol dehydrogenase/diacetyl reductase